MTRRYKDKLGGKAWVALASFILAYDLWAIRGGHETLSGAFWRSLENPYSRPFVLLAWIIVTKHLVFPSFLAEADPFNLFVEKIRKSEGIKCQTSSE